jgi:hypothetical protein
MPAIITVILQACHAGKRVGCFNPQRVNGLIGPAISDVSFYFYHRGRLVNPAGDGRDAHIAGLVFNPEADIVPAFTG